MSDLSAAAAALGVPEAIVKRSAEARAKATGASIDEVLAAWAGGAPAPSTQEPKAEAAAPAPPDSTAETADTTEQPTPASALTTSESPVSRLTSHVSEPPPTPREVSPKEAVRYPVVVAFPTAGLKERTRSTIPWWLAATFVIIPLFGLLQLAGATTNECGVGTELLPDRVTGELRNCDGTEFEGRGTGGGGTDFLAVGGDIYAALPGACQGCHGAEGQGGVGPAMSNVVATFSSCLDHIEWVAKGTPGFQAEGRTVYGDTGKPVGGAGIMPPFGSSLNPEQLAAVVAFERIRFGGQPREEALVDCGLGEVPAENGEAPEPGAAGETTTTQAP